MLTKGKKSVKISIFKISKNPGKKMQEKLENFLLRFVGGVALINFAPIGLHVNENENIRNNNKKKKF